MSLVGVRGYGGKLALAMKETGMFEIVTSYHPDIKKNTEAAKIYGCHPAESVDEAFSHKGVEAVIIATPDHTHLFYIQKAFAHEKHVFVDKPMVVSVDEAMEVYDDLKGNNLVFFVGHNMRREGAFRFIKKEFDEGMLGRLVTFEIVLSHGGAFNWSPDYWRTNPEFCKEGPIRVNGVHASDVLEYIFGPISSVFARMSHFSGQRTPDSGVALVEVGGATGTVFTHWVVPSLDRFTFQFTEALIEYDLKRLLVRYGRDVDCAPSDTKEVLLPRFSARDEQMKEFAGAILNRNMPETGWKEGYRAVLFFDACYRSYIEERPIHLKG